MKKLLENLPTLDEIKREKAKRNFWQFCLYVDEPFFTERQAVLKQVAEAFQEIDEGKIDLLYVGMPPRTGKSYITSLFCAWLLGKYPDEAIMRNTVTATLYSKFSTDIRDIMKGKTHEGRYLEIFPETEFVVDKVDGWKLKQSRHGVSYFGAGVGGSIIGFGCTKAAILDDSVKNIEEAMSETILKKKWDWYTSTHRSRKEKGCPEIHIATRWSKNDIPGRLEAEGLFDKDNAKKIVIPALINGESYCEAAHTTEELLREKAINDDVIWQAEWMQNPIEAKGLLFNPDDLNRFELSELSGKPDAIIGYCDTADEGNDYLSFPVIKQYGDKYFVVDVVFTQDPVEITQPQVASAIIDNKVQTTTIESNSGGRTYAVDIERILQQERYYCDIKTKTTTTNKETRILMQSGFIKKHFYFRTDYKEGSQYARFMEQLTTYSKDGKNKHDDAPDSITGLAETVRSGHNTEVKIDLNFGRRTSPWKL